jgi:hypothetical protein
VLILNALTREAPRSCNTLKHFDDFAIRPDANTIAQANSAGKERNADDFGGVCTDSLGPQILTSGAILGCDRYEDFAEFWLVTCILWLSVLPTLDERTERAKLQSSQQKRGLDPLIRRSICTLHRSVLVHPDLEKAPR